AMAALAKHVIQPSHEIRLIPGVDVLVHQFPQRLGHRIYITTMSAHVGQDNAGNQVVIADGHIVKVTSSLSLVDGDRGYPCHHARQLYCPNSLSIAAPNLIANQ